MVDTAEIESWCVRGILPEQDTFHSALTEETGAFTEVEGQHWDFKEQWPFSYSDSYFGGICRLICGFSNSAGGIIIFGVNDKTRAGGKNKVRPNIDKLILAFEQLTGRKFDFDYRSYPGSDATEAVDALLVKPRPKNTKPLVFQKKLANYDARIIWTRHANEVVRAEPQHYPAIFLPSSSLGVDGSIPPSSAQIKKFIGRAEAMTDLFDWLQNSDEPRTYLYGKGGSGKTTIAREFARLIKTSGGDIDIDGENKLDIVLFVSAKERELISSDAEVIGLGEPDFFDEESLLKKIILLSGGDPDIGGFVAGDLKSHRGVVTEYFNLFSYLIVIDDIDTLTTKGVDPGADFLYKALSRAKKRSKILYTSRNAPTQSLHNSIEVPGLFGDEYEKFVDECISKFKTPQPSKQFRSIRLPELSERRPLVIEAIIALSRTCGGFDGAERLFMQNIGDNIRDYVFSREWDSLPGGLERPLLTALADLNRPTSFGDLKIVLQAGDSSIRDAIGGVREMFLGIDDAGGETLYYLAPLTRGFVLSKRDSVKLYPAVKQRVSNFKKTIKLTSPEVARIISSIRRFTPLKFNFHSEQNLNAVFQLVRDPKLGERVTEDPVFRAAKGYVEAIQKNPDMPAVRGDFLYSIQMKHEPEFEELMAWFNAEKGTQSLEDHLYKIMDTVISGRRYTEDEKIGMISRKATTAYNFAKQQLYTDPTSAMDGFYGSLLLHLKAFKLNALSGSPMISTSEKYASNTADQWLRLLFSGNKWEVISAFNRLEKECDGYLDPIVKPFSSCFGRIASSALFSSEKARIYNEARKLDSAGFNKDKWMDKTILPDFKNSIQSVIEATRSR